MKDTINSPRLRELRRERSRTLRTKILLSLFAFVIVCTLLVLLSQASGLNIHEVQIVGNKALDVDAIKETVESELGGKYVWLFPKTNVMFYPKENIAANVTEKFKRLKDVSLSIKENRTLVVSVSEHTPKFMWCGVVASSTDQCYFLDDGGYIFDEAPYISGDVYFKFYGEEGVNTDSPSGSYFFKEKFNELVKFKDSLALLGIQPEYIIVSKIGDVDVYLKSQSTVLKPKIILKTDSDFEKALENLDAALSTDPLTIKFKKEYSLLQYIDLRFQNKVFYKFNE